MNQGRVLAMQHTKMVLPPRRCLCVLSARCIILVNDLAAREPGVRKREADVKIHGQVANGSDKPEFIPRIAGGHHSGFLTCVRTRARTVSSPEVAHRSTTACHVSNICLRLGRRVQWDPATEHFVNDPEADRFLARAMRSPWRL